MRAYCIPALLNLAKMALTAFAHDLSLIYGFHDLHQFLKILPKINVFNDVQELLVVIVVLTISCEPLQNIHRALNRLYYLKLCPPASFGGDNELVDDLIELFYVIP
jgi:hypothetical protein